MDHRIRINEVEARFLRSLLDKDSLDVEGYGPEEAKALAVSPAFSATILADVDYEIYIGYRILSLHTMAGEGVDVRGFDYVNELDLVKHTSSPDVQQTDPLRFKLAGNPTYTLIRRLEERIRSLERAR